MLKLIFTTIAKANKLILPSFSKRNLDLANANKWQLAIIGWRYYITKKVLDYRKSE